MEIKEILQKSGLTNKKGNLNLEKTILFRFSLAFCFLFLFGCTDSNEVATLNDSLEIVGNQITGLNKELKSLTKNDSIKAEQIKNFIKELKNDEKELTEAIIRGSEEMRQKLVEKRKRKAVERVLNEVTNDNSSLLSEIENLKNKLDQNSNLYDSLKLADSSQIAGLTNQNNRLNSKIKRLNNELLKVGIEIPREKADIVNPIPKILKFILWPSSKALRIAQEKVIISRGSATYTSLKAKKLHEIEFSFELDNGSQINQGGDKQIDFYILNLTTRKRNKIYVSGFTYKKWYDGSRKNMGTHKISINKNKYEKGNYKFIIEVEGGKQKTDIDFELK